MGKPTKWPLVQVKFITDPPISVPDRNQARGTLKESPIFEATGPLIVGTARLVGNEGINNPQYTNVKVEGPSFPTKGQPVMVI